MGLELGDVVNLISRRYWKSKKAISISSYPPVKLFQYSFNFCKLVVGLNLWKTSKPPKVMSIE